jgi:hypothetical protein
LSSDLPQLAPKIGLSQSGERAVAVSKAVKKGEFFQKIFAAFFLKARGGYDIL